MQPTEYIWQNGQLVPWNDAKTHVLSHTLHYGGGAFEGIRFYKTEKGPAIFRLDEHIERWFYSSQVLNMTLPYSHEELRDAMLETIRKNKIEEGYIRPLSFYGYGAMGVNPSNNPVEVIIACWPWGAYLPYDRVDIKTSNYIRIHPKSTVADAKICGHYVNGMLSNFELKGTHYHESLFLDFEGNIAEGAGANFFIVKDNVVYTPRLGNILAGITRLTAIEILHSMGLDVIETSITLDEAYAADEAFFTGTAAEVTPIRSIDDKIVGKDELGPISAKVKEIYHDLIRGKIADYEHYLTYVD